MALITIKDLAQSDALDSEAMRSIVGGGRSAVRPIPVGTMQAKNSRIVDYPPGFGGLVSIPPRSGRTSE